MLISLNTLAATLQAFKQFTDEPDVQIQALQTFLVVATVSNPSMNELAQRIGLTQSSASRNVKKLCELPRGQGGYGLITMTPDPMDHRRRVIKLSTRGHELIRHIETALMPPIRSHLIRELLLN
jgi:DNA-binding MarR family transcriptional regulator